MSRIIDLEVQDPKRKDSQSGVIRVVAEVDDKGCVSRELAFDDNGRLFHRYPGPGRDGERGYFELVPVDPSGPSKVGIEEFDRLWSLPDEMPDRAESRPGRFWLLLVAVGVLVASSLALS